MTEPTKRRQSTGDFIRELYANGMTHEQFMEILNLLPPIVPMPLPTEPRPRPADEDGSSSEA